MRPPKLPVKSLDILGKPFAVEDATAVLELEDGTLGKCAHAKCFIMLNLSQNRAQLRDTLLHEALHAIYSEMGLCEDIKEELEETIIRRMATGTLYLLRANPKFVSFLMEKQ